MYKPQVCNVIPWHESLIEEYVQTAVCRGSVAEVAQNLQNVLQLKPFEDVTNNSTEERM